MIGVQPTVVEVAAFICSADIDHDVSLGLGAFGLWPLDLGLRGLKCHDIVYTEKSHDTYHLGLRSFSGSTLMQSTKAQDQSPKPLRPNTFRNELSNQPVQTLSISVVESCELWTVEVENAEQATFFH